MRSPYSSSVKQWRSKLSTRILLSSAAVIAMLAGTAIAQTGGAGGGSAPGGGGSPGMSTGSPGSKGSAAGAMGSSERTGGGAQLGSGDHQPSSKRSGTNDTSSSEQRSGAADSTKTKDQKSGAADNRGGAKQQSGQASGTEHNQTGSISSSSNISSKQKTEIRSHISNIKVKAATNVNISKVSVGVVVPTTVEQYWEPVPASIIEIVPAWRSYRVVRIHDEIVIIEPSTRKIVYVIES